MKNSVLVWVGLSLGILGVHSLVLFSFPSSCRPQASSCDCVHVCIHLSEGDTGSIIQAGRRGKSIMGKGTGGCKGTEASKS